MIGMFGNTVTFGNGQTDNVIMLNIVLIITSVTSVKSY